jgi:hypothetical protein
MKTKITFALVTIGLVAACWFYSRAVTDAAMPLPHSQLACAHGKCIDAISVCREEPISGWNDSLYAAAKAPGVNLRPCRLRTDLAQGN